MSLQTRLADLITAVGADIKAVRGALVEPYTFSFAAGSSALAAPQTSKARVYLEGSYVVQSVRAALGLAVAGTNIIIDVNKNGTTLYTTQTGRPTIAVAAFTATGNAPDITTFIVGDYITVDFDTGSVPIGEVLTVTVRLRRTV